MATSRWRTQASLFGASLLCCAAFSKPAIIALFSGQEIIARAKHARMATKARAGS